jgi:hypothetical protein
MRIDELVDPNERFLFIAIIIAPLGDRFPGCDGTSVLIEASDANPDVVATYHLSPAASGLQQRGAGADLDDVAP